MNMEIENLKNEISADRLLEVAKLLTDRGDFLLAIPKFVEAAEIFLQKRDFENYLDCQNNLLRIYAEQESFEEVHKLKERIQDLVLKEGFELNAKTYYTLAICAAYRDQNETALDYLQKSLAIALGTDNKKDICYAINGIAICYKNLGKYSEALKELYNLQIFFQVLDLPEVKISALMLNAQIYNELKKHDQALELYWQVFDLLKTKKILHSYIRTLYSLGETYLLLGDKEVARTHFKLAQRAVDPSNLVRLSRAINESLKALGEEASDANFDLVFEMEKHSVVERKLGKVDFKNQFILMDLLKLFVTNQGQVFSKEYLVEHVWKQGYDPAIHDNKIYVTIKRLRKMIEPDYEKPKYIFRAKNGYFMNKSAKVHIESRGEQQ
jgi:tetratricopeptide (TPR) repeat protein